MSDLGRLNSQCFPFLPKKEVIFINLGGFRKLLVSTLSGKKINENSSPTHNAMNIIIILLLIFLKIVLESYRKGEQDKGTWLTGVNSTLGMQAVRKKEN